ncbi:cell wall hydrolase [Candidatus Kaiserbacteria bacterium]|nr:cell wall hydrolase [Candidatus Kaiserbacteria bacterium]
MRKLMFVSALALIGLCATAVLFPTQQDRRREVEKVDAVVENTDDDFLRSELDCLALNVYHEGRAEPEEGQRLIADVTLLRWKANRPWEFGGPSICDVVHFVLVHKRTGRRTPAFAWTFLPKDKQIPKEKQAWESAQRIARQAWDERDTLGDPSMKAMWYMNPRASNPRCVRWFRQHLVKVKTVGKHEAYREPASIFEKIELLAASIFADGGSPPQKKKVQKKKKK